jgi:hypothetical protein
VSYAQTSQGTATLTLTKGGLVVGTLTLAGNYSGSQFHLRLDSAANAFISLQSIVGVVTQPASIGGTIGSDTLVATANGQTLTGYGGTDTLSGGAFTGIDFKDTSANLNGSTIASFVTSDTIDLTDMKPGSVSLTYTPAVVSANAAPVPASLVVTDGTHAATVTLSVGTALGIGSWSGSSDGGGGTQLKYTALSTDAYAFGSSLGGTYSLASSWQDVTTAAAATQLPGYGNGVTVAGGANSYTDVSGSGVAASLTTSGNVLWLGSLNVGGATPGVSGALTETGTLALDGGASLTLAGSATVGGLLEVGGGSRLTAAGSVTFSSNTGSLLALKGSVMQFGGVITNGDNAYSPLLIAVDGNSSIEFGSTGGARSGALTIDAGVTASLGGSIDGNVVVNGTLAASGQALGIGAFGLATPSVTGAGMLEIDSGGILALAGSDSAAIQFSASSSGTLALGTVLPTGTISGFAKGDAITLARPVTTLRYSQTGSTGVLTLFNGSATVGTLLFAGAYSAQQFQVQLAAGGTSSTITYAATPNTTTGTQISTGTDAYGWTNTGGGAWSNAGNWTDTTTGKAAVTAPGAGNAVVINDSPGASTSQIISGSGSASSLAVYSPASAVFTGTVAITGAFWIAGSGTNSVTLANGARFSVGQLNDYGTLLLTGGSITVAGPVADTEIVGTLNVVNGSSVTAAGALDIGGGTLGVDATSSFEFGSAGGATGGALTIDAGQTATLQENGAIAANLVVNGTLIVNNASIGGFGGAVGAISGSGTIQIGTVIGGGQLTLREPDSALLLFYHASGAGYDGLEVQGTLPTGAIKGFGVGDTIQLNQAVTGGFFTQTSASQGVLTLMNGGSAIGTLTLLGNYASSRFQIDVAAATGFATISLLPATSSSGSAAANSSYDAYNWIGVSGGSWSTASNWMDTTQGRTLTTVPGASTNGVTIASNVAIGGNGSAGNLAVTGSVLLTGHVIVSWTTTIGAASGASASVAEAGGAWLITGNATVTGRWEVGAGSVGVVYYFATLAGGTLLSLGGSTVQIASLMTSGGNNVLAVDSYSIIKVGGPPTAAQGALTLAAGISTAFGGSIYGNVVANGTLQAPGGGTLLIDMTGTAASAPYSAAPTISGTGSLWLAEGSTLGIGAADSAAIQFGGPNATLLLAVLPTGTISGFAAGDQIEVTQTVTGLSFQQATGTLTLTNGAATVGTLKLAGSYTGSAFHLDAAPNGGFATISLQTLGVAATQPTLIQGTAASDVLTATANGQTLTGNGGNDLLSTGGFTGIDLKDATANMNYYSVTNFGPSDWLDFTDMNPATASVRYGGGVVSITDGVHAANMQLAFGTMPASGSFSVTSDGAGGSKIVWS